MKKLKNMLKTKFHKWNYLDSKCRKCGSRNISDYENYHCEANFISEYDIICKDCGNVLNHFHHGYMEYPQTKTEQIEYIWDNYYSKKLWDKVRLTIIALKC